MTTGGDDLDRLKAAMRAATPAPDPAARAAALARAGETFARRQETAGAARHNSERAGKAPAVLEGVGRMIAYMTSHRALLTASGLAIAGIGVMLALPQAERPIGGLPPLSETAPAAAPDAPGADGRGGGTTASRPAPAQGRDTAAPAAPAMEAEAPARAARRHAGTAADAPRAAELFADVAGGPAAAPAPTPEMQSALAPAPEGGTERFAAAPANPLKVTVEEPVSTFSIDVDTASYAFVRRALREGRMPPAGAVRVEEMINYFPYAYRAPAPGGDAPFATHVSVFETPWNADTALVRIGIQGARPAAAAERPPLDLVFLVDSSGSMQDPDKLPLLKRSLAMMLPELRPGDTVAIVTYAGAAGTVLEPTPAAERNRILDALDRLEAGGSTAGAAGLEAAYALAEDAGGAGRIGRVILATDGDFNVGPATPEALKAFIAEKRETGLYLSVLGFGRGNYNDALMQALAQNGNGQAAYIDTLAEARKVLVDQLTGALYPIADDVKIQVEFNPAAVAEYRLVGYETRVLAREDFNDDTVDAGEIGAGHSVTALYEVTPVGSPAVRTTPLRYAAEAPQAGSGPADEIGFLRLRYKAPGAAASRLIEAPVPATLSAPDDEAAFAAAIAGFGQLLTGGRYLNGWDYADAIALAGAARGDDPFGYRAEAVTLMRLAESLSR